jgi:hypothetical protein
LFRSKTILVPSGDQAGFDSVSGLLVTFFSPVPSAFMTKISELIAEDGSFTKAIFVPSGDQAGFQLRPEPFVRRC